MSKESVKNQSILKFVVKKNVEKNDSKKKNNNIFDFDKQKMTTKTKIPEELSDPEPVLPEKIKKLENELKIEKEKNKKLQSDLSA